MSSGEVLADAAQSGTEDAGRIQQRLRARGDAADRRARQVFRWLVVTILVGLIFYLGLPFWSQWVDGRRETFLDTQQSIDAGNAALDSDRTALAQQLGEALSEKPAATALPGPLISPIGHVVTTEGVVIYGRSDKLAFLSNGADSLREVAVPEFFSEPLRGFSNHVEFAGQTVLFGNARGALVFRNDPGEALPVTFGNTSSDQDNPSFMLGSLASESALYLFGSAGTILRTRDPSDWFERLETGTAESIVAGHVQNGTPLFAGPGGLLLEVDDGGNAGPIAEQLEIDLSGAVTVAVEAPAGWLLLSGPGVGMARVTEGGDVVIPGPLPQEIAGGCCGADAIVQGDRIYSLVNNAVVTSQDGGETFTSGVEIGNLPNAILATSEAMVVYSAQVNPAYRSIDGGRSFDQAPGAPGIYYGHIVFEDIVILYGATGSVARSFDGGRSFATIEPVADYLYGHATDGEALVLFGGNGNAVYAAAPTAPLQAIPLPLLPDAERTTQLTYGGGLSLGDGAFFVYGEDGYIQIDWKWRDAFNSLELAPGSEGDISLTAFIDRLPNHIRSGTPIAELRQAVGVITAQRDVLTDLQNSTDAELQRLNDFPHSLLLLERQRESFAGFMATCRGATDWQVPPAPRGVAEADPDAITLACLEGWQAQVAADDPSPWALLAEQLPPGILLLFLLATLSGLYRYNLRLAGFHHSRADTVALATVEGGDLNAEDLLKYADALAADRVEFGKSSTPSDQAVDIVRSVVNRG